MLKKKVDSIIHCLQGTHFSFKDTNRFKGKRWNKDIPHRWKQKENSGNNTYNR